MPEVRGVLIGDYEGAGCDCGFSSNHHVSLRAWWFDGIEPKVGFVVRCLDCLGRNAVKGRTLVRGWVEKIWWDCYRPPKGADPLGFIHRIDAEIWVGEGI